MSRPSLLLRILLGLQPRRVRERYREEWLETARAREEEARERGAGALFRHRLREVTGALRSGATGRMGGGAAGGDPAGGRTRTREVGMGRFIQDLRYGLRSLTRAPGFTLAAVAILGVGVGTATVMYSAVHAVLLAPLPFAQPGQLVALWERNPDFGWEQAVAAPANMLDWRDRVEGFQDVAAYRENVFGATWIVDGEPRQVGVTQTTGNFFQVLGVRPALGTLPTWDDTWSTGEAGYLVASHAFWRDALGSDPEAVGRALTLDGRDFRIAAVLPPEMGFPSREVDLYASYAWAPEYETQAWFRRAHFVTPIARLAPGVTPEQAADQLDAVALQLQEEHPELNTNMFAGLTPLRPWLAGDLTGPLRVLMAGVCVLLLLACVNVGNLFLVRATGRGREISVRRVLGADGGRIVRQLLSEGLLVGAAAGGVGVLLSVVGIQALQALRPVGIAGATTTELNGPVLAFAVAASLLSVLLFALWPSVHAAGGELAARLRSGTAGSGRDRRMLGQGLVPVQLALAVLLVLGAGLVTRSFARLQSEDPGVDPAGVHVFTLSIPEGAYPDRDAVLGFWDRVEEEVEAIPGVESAAVTTGVALAFSGWTSQVMGRDWSPEEVAFEVRHRASTPGYFETMRVPLLQGRSFTATDGLEGERVAIVNRRFADLYYPGEDPVGEEITFDRVPDENSVWRRIVGVVGDERQRTLSLPPDPEVWQPLPQDWGHTRTVVLRTGAEIPELGRTLQERVARVDPLIPVVDLRSMEEVVAAAAADARFLLVLFNVFAGVALLLASVGVYGVTAQAVRRRVPEFGVRMALGAERSAVSRLVLRRVLPLAGSGVAAGVLGGLLATTLLDSLLYQVGTRDPLTFSLVPLGLLAVALVAAWIPARRAGRVDPVRSLRAE